MAFLKNDRQLLAKQESTEGEAATLAAADDFIEVIDPTFTITPAAVDRNIAHRGFTPVPQYVGSGTAAVVEMTFGVEMAVQTTTPSTTAPRWGRLLTACGLAETGSVERMIVTGQSGDFLHREDAGGSTDILSDCFASDNELFFAGASGITTGSVTGAVSGATATEVSEDTAGFCYGVDTTQHYGQANTVTLQMYLDGQRVKVAGCRGNVEWSFTIGDRVVMNFTFTGFLSSFTGDAANCSTHTYGHAAPPAFIGANLELNATGGTDADYAAVLNSLTLSLGNEVSMREDANSTNGYKAAIITGRAPTVSLNPDVVAETGTNQSFMSEYIAGTTARMRFEVGTIGSGGGFIFKAPALQWTGMADSERDGIFVYDASATLTGGTHGSTVDALGTGQEGDTYGFDNEFFFFVV